MADLASDNFNRANDTTLGAGWTTMSGNSTWEVASNQARAPADPCASWNNGLTWPADQASRAIMVNPQAYLSGNGPGLCVRASAAANTAYFVLFNADGTELYRVVAGTYVQLTTVANEASNGHECYLEATGTGATVTLKVRINGVEVISFADTDATRITAAGNAGIFGANEDDAGPIVDDWVGGDPVGAAIVEQEGFRFRKDDGSETTATWVAVQDTDVTYPLDTNLRLRMLLDTTGDVAGKAYRLEYKLSSSSIWNPVAAHASAATLSWGADGGVNVSGSGGTSVAPPYPTGITVRSCLVLVIGQKPTTANGGTVTTPSGWTLRTSLEESGGYTTTLGADTGNTNIFVYTKNTVDGTETGSLTVTVGDNGVCWGIIMRVESDVAPTWSFAGTTGEDTSAGNVSITFGADPGVAAGDFILAGMCIPTDVTTPSQFSSEALSQTGITFGTVTEIIEPDSGTGNDIGGFLVRAPVSSGTSSAAPVLTATAGGTTTNVRGPGFFLRIRATPYQPIELAASSNITAGGENTTPQLTPPGSKSTSDHGTGRMWDDENGAETQDIPDTDYIEDEWCMKALAANGAANAQVYNFRVTDAGSVLTNYLQSPDWTIGTTPAPSRRPRARRVKLRRLFHH